MVPIFQRAVWGLVDTVVFRGIAKLRGRIEATTITVAEWVGLDTFCGVRAGTLLYSVDQGLRAL